jgi:prevent-host-death family protein
MMARCRVISASEFKAKCSGILDRIRSREFERVVITKRGVPVAVLVPLAAEVAQVEGLHGFLRGSVVIPREIDLTAPVADEAFAGGEGHVDVIPC